MGLRKVVQKKRELVAVARLGAAFGIKGYLKAHPLTHDPGRIEKLKKVTVGNASADASEATVEDVRSQHNGIVLKLDIAVDRTAAERLTGQYVFVPAAASAKLPKGSYFIDDIVGCTAEDDSGAILGKVVKVEKYPAQDVWIIEHGETSTMIPAVKEFIKSVDIAKHTVVLQNVGGFFEL